MQMVILVTGWNTWRENPICKLEYVGTHKHTWTYIQEKLEVSLLHTNETDGHCKYSDISAYYKLTSSHLKWLP